MVISHFSQIRELKIIYHHSKPLRKHLFNEWDDHALSLTAARNTNNHQSPEGINIHPAIALLPIIEISERKIEKQFAFHQFFILQKAFFYIIPDIVFQAEE